MIRKMSPRKTWQRLRTVPGLGRDALTLALTIAVGLVAGVVILSKMDTNAPWQERFKFAGIFESAPAVSPEHAQEVRIAGVEVGKITGTEPTSKGQARVTMEIDPGQAVYDNARLVLRPKNQLNEMYVEMDPGEPPARRLPNNGVLPMSQTKRPVQATEVLSHLDERTRSAVTTLLSESDVALAKAPQELPGGLRATDDTLGKLRPVVEALRTRRETIGQLVTSFSQISGAVGKDHARLGEMIKGTDRVLTTLAGRDDELSKTLNRLPGFTGQLKEAMDDTSKLTEQLNPTLDNAKRAAGALPSSLARMTDTVREIRDTARVARPAIKAAKPVVSDLRPVVSDLRASADALKPTTGRLDEVTRKVLYELRVGNIQGFVYNTKSAFAIRDKSGAGFARGSFGADVSTLGTGYSPDDVPEDYRPGDPEDWEPDHVPGPLEMDNPDDTRGR